MEYVKVESSQIEAIGFGDGFYGPETLGIQFPPTKKQAAAGQSGSTYHYANVSPRMHQALMAAPSIGSYFDQNIKAHPEQYPYTKVEADPHQPRPSNGMSGAKMESMPLTQTPTLEATDAPSPVTSLAVIDTLENNTLFASGGVTDAQIAAGREWYLANAPKGIETEEKRTALKRFARPLQKLRTGIEARAKEFTGETKRILAAIDTEKRRLVLLVGGIEDEVLRPLTEWAQEEEARKIRLAGIANELSAKGQRVYMDMAEIEKAIAELESFDVSTMQEYRVGAESAIAASLRVLKPELERRKVAEANEAELAKLRAEAAERAEKDRVAQIAADARVEAERKAAAEVAAAQVRAEQAEKMRLADEQNAARRAEEAAAQAKRDQEAAVEAERKRNIEATERAQAEAAARAADVAHRTKANYEAASALVAECLIDEPSAHEVISAIAKGLIPNVTIAY